MNTEPITYDIYSLCFLVDYIYIYIYIWCTYSHQHLRLIFCENRLSIRNHAIKQGTTSCTVSHIYRIILRRRSWNSQLYCIRWTVHVILWIKCIQISYLHSYPNKHTGGMTTADEVIYHMFYENTRQSTSICFLCVVINIVNQEMLCYRFTMQFVLTALYLALCVICRSFFHWCTFWSIQDILVSLWSGIAIIDSDGEHASSAINDL